MKTNTPTSLEQVRAAIVRKLRAAGIHSTVFLNRGAFYIEPTSKGDSASACDALGMARFRDYMHGIEVVVG